MQYWKKFSYYFNVLVLIIGLLIPLLLFLNRFLIPDVSFDSINYHLYLGFKGLNWENNKYEFYTTGIHNFSTILEIPGYVLMKLFGYRIGTIGSIIFLYISMYFLYKIYKLIYPKYRLTDNWWTGLFFISSFLSFESFLQIATYYIDIEVMCLMLVSTYFLFKFEKTKKLKDLIISSFFVSVFVLGKMTTWYYLFPYFGYLLYVLCVDNSIKTRVKIYNFGLSVLISVMLVIPWLYNNLKLTGNPVFPFYNGIFKSDFFVKTNFSQVIFGGRNFIEKLFWGIYSAMYPVRLGEVHDLFTDYKINIYFITAIVALTWSVYKKNYKLLKFVLFYLGLYLTWSLSFGYLRYGLILETLGGLLILMWFVNMLGFTRYLFLVPVLCLLFVQGKKIVNMSLAYDISFRPGYYYNNITYPKEAVNFKHTYINIDSNIIDKYNPNVYLNCAIPAMTFYPLSEFVNLPVINIDNRAYNDMVTNQKYIDVSKTRLLQKVGDNNIRFVTISPTEGLENGYGDCVNNLKNKKYTILEEIKCDNFLGYKGQKLVVIFGEKSL